MRVSRALIPAFLAALVLGATAGSALAAGFTGPSYDGLSTSPTGSRPEAKLWFADGIWWASMLDANSGGHHIFRLDRAAATWRDTGVALDPRPNSRADVLWEGGHLYVVSNDFTESPKRDASDPARLWRFSYNAAADTWTRDAGYPVAINDARSESITIAHDSTGRLWATWMLGSQIYVNHSTTDQSRWSTPYVLPVGSQASVSADDISHVVAFGGGKIGVLWSNQSSGHFHFAVHADGAGDDAADWSATPIDIGSLSPDDHVEVAADHAGRLYAAVKHTPTSAGVSLLVRSTTGAWSRYPVTGGSPTRPIVMLDEEHAKIHVFYATEGGGAVFQRSSSMGSISFGSATTVIDGGSQVNNPTGTHQLVHSGSGMIVLASDPATKRYYWDDISVGPPPSNRAPTVSLAVDAPTDSWARTNRTVKFTAAVSDPDGATDILEIAWDLDGDGAYDDATGPTAQTSYPTAGTRTVGVRAADSVGNEATSSLTFAVQDPSPPVADFTVDQTAPTTNRRITLTSTSTDADGDLDLSTLAWDLDNDGAFDDAVGGTATVTFPTAGTSSVGLRVADRDGTASSVYKQLTVAASPPVAAFDAPAAMKVGRPTTFTSRATDVDGDITEQAWDLDGDGSYADDATVGDTATTTFPTGGAANPHTVGLRVTDAAGNVVEARQTFVVGEASAPTVDFTSSPSAPRTGKAVTFTVNVTDDEAVDPSSIHWYFGSSSTPDATGATATTSFASTGVHPVRVEVTDAERLTGSAAHEITVIDASAPVAAFEVAPGAPIVGQPVTLTSSSADADDDIVKSEWDLDGDGDYDDAATGSNAQTSYVTPGEKTIGLRVTDADGATNTTTRTFTVAGGPSTLRLLPTADASVSSKSTSKNFGKDKKLRVQGGKKTKDTRYRTFLRFVIDGAAGRTVTSAKLRLKATATGKDGGAVWLTASDWDESLISWQSAPALPAPGTPIAQIGRVKSKGVVEIDVTRAVTGDGTVTFALVGADKDDVVYASRETSTPAELVVTLG